MQFQLFIKYNIRSSMDFETFNELCSAPRRVNSSRFGVGGIKREPRCVYFFMRQEELLFSSSPFLSISRLFRMRDL